MRGSLSGEKEEKKENEEKRDSLSTAGGTTWLLEKDTLHEMVTPMQYAAKNCDHIEMVFL